MTIRGYSNAIVDVMLGWLKGLANWVLRLFNLAGSASTSPLYWLSQNWLKLLIFFLVLGVVLDSLIWLIRWRPYWVWFRKERVIVNDEKFFMNADMDKAGDRESDLASNWDEHDYVVASTVVRRRAGERARPASAKGGKRQSPTPRRRSERTKVKRRVERPQGAEASRGRDRAGLKGGEGERGADARSASEARRHPDSIFAGELKRRDVSDVYEDEVFNVSNLPAFDEYNAEDAPRRKGRSGKRRG